MNYTQKPPLKFQQYNLVSDTVAHSAMMLSRIHCQYNDEQGLETRAASSKVTKSANFQQNLKKHFLLDSAPYVHFKKREASKIIGFLHKFN